tara:strand:- start:1598 stop:2425 length:828 start_codon:yes stop_codon:yes gene_type:complete
VPNLEGTREIETIEPILRPQAFRFAIFDFDGTLSLIREGWREIMIPMMVSILRELDTSDSEADLTDLVADFIDDLTGQQTIFQMIRLCEEIRRRGGEPGEAVAYKRRFNNQLLAHIDKRIERLETGTVGPEDMMIPGSVALLEALRAREIELYLASGTDHDYVVREAGLLGIDGYFAGIYGALDNYEDFSKAKIIAHILEENNLEGDTLLGFGDGYVEIENVSQVGGTAIGVASNETTREGINSWKRERLVKAGASLIVPHYLELDPLLEYLFPH